MRLAHLHEIDILIGALTLRGGDVIIAEPSGRRVECVLLAFGAVLDRLVLVIEAGCAPGNLYPFTSIASGF